MSCSREFVTLSDGGHVALDWAENENSVIDASKRPTVIILPGLTGIFCYSDIFIFNSLGSISL